jgi:hypothetical protein
MQAALDVLKQNGRIDLLLTDGSPRKLRGETQCMQSGRTDDPPTWNGSNVASIFRNDPDHGKRDFRCVIGRNCFANVFDIAPIEAD